MEDNNSVQKRFYPARLNPEDPHKITLVPITEEQFHTIMPPIWKHQRKMKALGMCTCTQQSTWKCDADCELCGFMVSGHVTSLDERYEEADDNSGHANNDPASIVSNQMLAHQVLTRLKEIFPEALKVGELVQDGLSQREATEKLGISRTLYRYHLAKALRQIEIELKIKDIQKFF